MDRLTSRSAAMRLGINPSTLSRYISSGKIAPPKIVRIGGLWIQSWTEKDVERIRAFMNVREISTGDVADRLGIPVNRLKYYIDKKKLPAPKANTASTYRTRVWTERDIERVRAALPKIVDGRKTRYQKLRRKRKTRKSKG